MINHSVSRLCFISCLNVMQWMPCSTEMVVSGATSFRTTETHGPPDLPTTTRPLSGPTRPVGPPSSFGPPGQNQPTVTNGMPFTPANEIGSPGPPAPPGPPGEIGYSGPPATPGPPGEIGSPGPPVTPGPTGEIDSPGRSAPPSPPGEIGSPSPPAPPGPPGEIGSPSPPAPPSPPGETGFPSPPAPTGPPGQTGSPGPPATPWPPGKTGFPSPPATLWPPGEIGSPSPLATPGPPGENGSSGPPATLRHPGETGSPGLHTTDGTPISYAHTQKEYHSSLSTESSISKDDSGSTHWYTTAQPISWTDDLSLYAENFSPIDYITNICPNTKSCQTVNTPDSFEPQDSCCLKCDCSDDCFVKGNCCHDKDIPDHLTEQETPTSSLNESCVFPMYGYQSIHELIDANKKSVLIIASCPEDMDIFTSLDRQSLLVESCKNPEMAELRSIRDIAPVYSTIKGVSYSNKFCATCNVDSTSLMPWKQMTLSCANLTSFSILFSTASSLQSFLETVNMIPCILEFHPPHNGTVECLHHDAVISECAEDFPQHKYNPKLRDYCENVTAPFGRDRNIYKNIFCFGCNELLPNIHNSACQSYAYGYGYDFGEPEAELNVKALDDGLFVAAKNETKNSADEQCEEGSMYDQYLEQCVAYVCAPSKVNVQGKCLPVIKTLNNVGLDFKLTYRFLVGTAKIEKSTYETLTLRLWFNDTTRALCRISTKTKASLRDYHVTYTILLTRVLSEMTNIEEEYFELRERISHQFNRQVGFETSLDNDGYKFVSFGTTDFVRFSDVERTDSCPESVAMVDLQFCDAVMFRIAAEQRDKKGNLVVKSVIFKRSEYLIRTKPENSTVLMYAQICRDLFSKKIDKLQEKIVTSDGDDRSGKLKIVFLALLAVVGFQNKDK